MGASAAALIIGGSLRTAMAAAARAAYPEECCGLLVGRYLPADGAGTGARWQVTRVVPAANRHPQPRRHFEVDPVTHIALLRQLREREAAEGEIEILLGHYHSHPEAAALPSASDLAQANDPTLIWVIIGPVQGGAPDVTAWRVIPRPAGPAGFEPLPFAAATEQGAVKNA